MKKPLLMAASVLAVSLLTVGVSIQPVQAADVVVYSVRGVTAGQLLNMRSGAGTNNSLVTKIPANATGVVATGEEKRVGNTTWAKVYWAGKGGWVSKTYLTTSTNLPPTQPSPQPPASAGGIVMQCSGTEPFWGMTIAERDLKVDMMDGPDYTVPVTFRQTSANDQTIAVIAGASGVNTTQAFLQKVEACSDGMSDVKYPYAITAVINNRKVYSGCCKVQR